MLESAQLPRPIREKQVAKIGSNRTLIGPTNYHHAIINLTPSTPHSFVKSFFIIFSTVHELETHSLDKAGRPKGNPSILDSTEIEH
jgi:hypothetical protein